jgi:6,7-dimethyl-8-ribityllumazine synthase
MTKVSIAIIISDYYKKISDGLIAGAKDYCNENKLSYKTYNVVGALEIAGAIKIISDKSLDNSFDGYVALGCVIRGETSHFDIVINESSRALTNLTLNNSLIIGNGILTVENEEQAISRSLKNNNNKGYHAAHACHDLISLRESL